MYTPKLLLHVIFFLHKRYFIWRGAINDTILQVSNPNLPFGSVGSSGFGRYRGEAGFAAFSNLKSILDKPTWLETSFKYAPYTMRKLAIIKQLFKFQ
ncbi:MAG: aldehyde dehydrogenase (NAD+) [Flavobacteriales bacterium]